MGELGLVSRIPKQKFPNRKHAKNIMAKRRYKMFAKDSKCYYCRCQMQLPTSHKHERNTATIDHKTPRSRKGHKTAKDNLALCCFACNNAKGSKTEAEFRACFQRSTDN